MASLNKVMLIGRVGKDPEEHISKTGIQMVHFSLATSETWTDKKSGERKEATEWHNLTAFNKTAELCKKYVQKGSLVYVEGKIKKEEFVGKDGLNRLSVKIIVDTIHFLGNRIKTEESVGAISEEPINDDIPF